MWIAPRFGENPPSYWSVLVLAATGLPHRNWVRDAISLAYEARNLPSPLSLRAHSTRGVASSQALFRGVPLEDICVAAGWSSPHTLSSFTTLTLIRLQVLRSCLFEPTVCCWFIIGPDRQRFQLGLFGISFPKHEARSVE